MRSFIVGVSSLAVFACLIGCGLGEALKVSSIQLGRSLNADGSIANPTTSFTSDDTIYVSVMTTGVGSGEIGVRWMYAGRVVGEPKKQVSYRDDAATEFHLQSTSGFPAGEYSVEAFFNGQSVGTQKFQVENR